MPSPKIVTIIGSINKDLVYVVPHSPAGGETLTAINYSAHAGGKGANQAVAAARLSQAQNSSTGYVPDVHVHMIGAVGSDGHDILQDIKKQGVHTSGIRVVDSGSTGTAMITVEQETGENRIILWPGTNHTLLTREFVESKNLGDPRPDLIVMQLEIPFDTVMQILKTAKEAKIEVLLNPAPAVRLPDEAYQAVTHLIVNETEAAILTGRDLKDVEIEGFNWKTVADEFIAKGVKNVVITLGSRGAYFATSDSLRFGAVQAEKVKKVVDTTAAGDTFVGACALKLVRKGNGGLLDKEDVQICCRAAGKTVESLGAIDSIPWGSMVEGMM